ncbi:MAG: PAS domain S-box protein [Victivallales bacterium]|nr:PAS domain S-box protein [Victivallales bacterium]
MSSALARRCGHDSYMRDLSDGSEEEFIVYYSFVPLDAFSHWVMCVEAPREAIRMASEGFPIVYAVPLVIFFFMIVTLSLLKRFFGNRYVGILEGVISSSRDARKEIESRLVAIMESFPYIIFETDRGGKFTFLNFAREHVGGISSEAFEGRSLIELVDSSETFSFKDAFARMVNEGGRLSHMRVSMCLDGISVRVMSVNASPVYDDEKEIVGTRGVMHDITERAELEMHLIQSQKMDSIGMVASGIAHDFNNYISTILGYVSMIKMKMKGGAIDEMDALEKAAQNAARLTGQLMEFSKSKDGGERIACTNPNETITTMVGILKKSLPHTIRLNVDLDDSLPKLKVSQTHLEQILLNLIMNARDAMPDGGDITVKCWRTAVNEIYSRQLDIQPGDYVILDVSDTGHGLSDEIKSRIFEPYFTTKKTGTGLGLATIYAILKNAGGNILVKSGKKKGTQFFLYIPQA